MLTSSYRIIRLLQNYVNSKIFQTFEKSLLINKIRYRRGIRLHLPITRALHNAEKRSSKHTDSHQNKQ